MFLIIQISTARGDLTEVMAKVNKNTGVHDGHVRTAVIWYSGYTDMPCCARLRFAGNHDISDDFQATDPCSPTKLHSCKPEFMRNRTLFVLPTSPV